MTWRFILTAVGADLEKQANGRWYKPHFWRAIARQPGPRSSFWPASALLTLLAPVHARADTNPNPPPAASYLCRQAIAAAERAHGIPTHLLAAIARVESGRRDQASGTFNPWPWTINFDGQGSFYDSKIQAVAAATRMRPRVARSIDVGCMQISLTMHPNAFASMDQAFDPQLNADYGARFLVQLYEKSASWPRAVEMYHSATPDLGRDYQQKVYAAWPEEKKLAVAEPAIAAGFFRLMAQQPRISPLSPTPKGSPNLPIFYSAFGQSTPHIINRVPTTGGDLPAGRTLDSYRLHARPPRVPAAAPAKLSMITLSRML